MGDSAANYRVSFNTQPPEGGWAGRIDRAECPTSGFNTQPPEGGWMLVSRVTGLVPVSTHSRLKAAGQKCSKQPQKL